MKILFIFPKGQHHNFWDLRASSNLLGKKYSSLPLAIPTLIGLTPKRFEVEVIDENIDDINFNIKVDLIAITFFTSFANRAYEIADKFRERNQKVVLGGIHVTMLPEEAILHADSIVIGEAEDIWVKLLNDLENNNLKKIYKSVERPDLQQLNIPRWDLVNLNYNFYTIQATRGCPYRCEFCSVSTFFGASCRFKPIANVIEEIKYLKKFDNKKTVVFADDNFVANHNYAKELIKELINSKIDNWWCQASLSVAKDDELLRLMQLSGCKQIFIGFESLSRESLELMNKSRVNIVDEFKSSIEKIHSYKISIFGSFIFGYDGDDKEIFLKTVNFINETNIAFALIGLMVPFPGTSLYKRLKNEDRILTEDWKYYNGEHVCFKPKKMTPKELLEGHKWVLSQIYSYNSLSKRLNYLWSRGILTKKYKFFGNYFSYRKWLIFFKILRNYLVDKNKERTYFISKSLFNKNNPRFFSIVSAIDFHEVVEEYIKKS